jgi:hypothetical protein
MRLAMHIRQRSALWLACIMLLPLSSRSQETQSRTVDIKAEAARIRDLKITARRMNISVEQLTNARAALKEATNLALRQNPQVPENYPAMIRLWLLLDRKETRATIASAIMKLYEEAQSAEDLTTYRKCTAPAFQLLSLLVEIDAEKARQIADLWPEPAANLGASGHQALTQFQHELDFRLASSAAVLADDQKLDQYLQPQRSSLLPFSPRLSLAASLANANQKEKARKILDQAIVDLAAHPTDPGKNSDIEGFVRSLAIFYPERFMDAFEIYQELLARQAPGTDPGFVCQLGDETVLLSPSESAAVNMMRGMYGRPELTLKLLESLPGLRAKLERVGGIDNILSPQAISLSNSQAQAVRYYPANMPPPPPPSTSGGDAAAPVNPASAAELLRSLRGKADANPEVVRRKLLDTCLKKEHFPVLMSLAQSASYQDPELSVIALEVAHSLLPSFENLQQRAASLRSLLSTTRRLEGEVDPTLLSEGYIMVLKMREDEKEKAQAASRPASGATVVHPSDDLEIYLLAQIAFDDFRAALSRVHSISEEFIRIRALLQIAQALSSNSY